MSGQNSYKVLVVDDEEEILDVVEGYFQRKGHEVYTATNGIEALKLVEGKKVDCCFTDINMPEMDGLELAEELRGKDETIPVVVMTGFPSLENTIQTLKNGVVDYLIKPIKLEDMSFTLERVIRERELFVENLLLKEEVERQEKLKRLNNELLARVEEVNILNKIMEDFSSAESSHDIFRNVVELGREVLKADRVDFYLWTEHDASLVLVADSETSEPDRTVGKNLGDDLAEKSKTFIKNVIVNDDKPCLVTQGGGKSDLPEGVLSSIVVPLKIRDKMFGVATASILEGNKSFGKKDIYYMNFITSKAASAIENIALYENIYDNLFSTLYAFVTALEVRDLYTREHSTRVAAIAYRIGKEMGCSDEELDIINFAGYLHDIGKIGIRDDILLKPGKLTHEEYEKVKEHPAIGADIVGQLGLWDREQQIIRWHHERYDGKGYPDGLKGGEIPKLSRILAVADAYDAMASDRSYRKRLPKDKIFEIISENAGRQFDPEAVSVFFKIVKNQRLDDF